MKKPYLKSNLIAIYLIFGLIIGYLLWSKFVHEDLSRCGQLAVCQQEYLFLFPFSIFVWPLATLAIFLWEPVGFLALGGVLLFFFVWPKFVSQKMPKDTKHIY